MTRHRFGDYRRWLCCIRPGDGVPVRPSHVDERRQVRRSDRWHHGPASTCSGPSTRSGSNAPPGGIRGGSRYSPRRTRAMSCRRASRLSTSRFGSRRCPVRWPPHPNVRPVGPAFERKPAAGFPVRRALPMVLYSTFGKLRQRQLTRNRIQHDPWDVKRESWAVVIGQSLCLRALRDLVGSSWIRSSSASVAQSSCAFASYPSSAGLLRHQIRAGEASHCPPA